MSNKIAKIKQSLQTMRYIELAEGHCLSSELPLP